MKKTIALILSAALLLAASLCAFPVSAETENTDPINATPLTGYTANAPFWQVVKGESVLPETTKKFVTANGMKLTAADNTPYSNAGVKNSQVLAQPFYNTDLSQGYKLPDNFAADGQLIMYVKTDSANKIHLQFVTTWAANYPTTAELTANAEYGYAAKDEKIWTVGNADENGIISFSEQFEGYIKIPVASMVSIDNVAMNYNYLGFMGIRFEGIGGDYGSVIAGPFFVTTDDSTSTKIVVPEEYRPRPINVKPIILTGFNNHWAFDASFAMPYGISSITNLSGIKLSGNTNGEQDLMGKGYTGFLYVNNSETHELPDGFTQNGSVIMYVKTDSLNEIVLMTRTNNGTLTKLKANGSYEYAKLGDESWNSAVINENGIIPFESAFEGFIKIPASSIVGYDFGENMVFDKLTYFDVRVGGIGGKFGDVTVGPFFVTTENSASTKLIVPEEYRPAPLNIKTFDFGDVHAATYAFSADKLENTNNYKLYIGDSVLSEDSVKYQGSDVTPKWSYLENGDGIEGADNWTALVMNTRVKTYMKDAAGIVFYVNFPKANMFAPCLTFDGANSIMLKPGEKVYVLQSGSDTWAEKSVENGYMDNALIYGKVTFDSAFEGYIKVPFTSLNSDWGWRPTLNGDNMSALTSVALRFKGIGDDAMYGKEIIAGVTGYYTTDTARAEIGSVTKPEYAAGDANYDWKVDSQDLVDVRKTLLGAGTYTGYDVTLLDLISVKKILSNVQ